MAISSSRGSSQSWDRTQVSCIAGRFFTVSATREALTSSLPGFEAHLLLHLNPLLNESSLKPIPCCPRPGRCLLSSPPPPCFPPSPPIARPILHQPPCCPSAHARVLRQQAALLSWAGATGEQDGRYRGPRAFHSFLFHHSLVLDSRTLFSDVSG